MLDALKQAGKNIGHELSRTWENLSEGWRELISQSSDALTHFARKKTDPQAESSALSTFPRWSLLAGEVEETDKEILVRVEVPGMEKEDCRITIEDNLLQLRGEKRYARESHDSTYHVMERAYGAFQRTIPLPRHVDVDKAEATYKNGVLHIRLPKLACEKTKTIPLS
ncbi:MAG TPA: Hsp20/alpha crystallin family protein [Gallionella sp.]|nr:Hsp20/alpha crystallin family protein [Gallionella sp.]